MLNAGRDAAAEESWRPRRDDLRTFPILVEGFIT
jgi:hypothetical protein